MAVLDLIELPLINRLVINEKLIPKGILFSDHLKFQPFLDYFVKNYPTPKPLNRFLIIIRDGNWNVDILHNKNFPLIMVVKPKRWEDPIPIGDIITFNADVQKFITIETKGINISDGDMFIGYISFSSPNPSYNISRHTVSHGNAQYRECTAIGNSDHPLNQDCDTIQSHRKENSDGETKTKNLHPRV